MERTEESISEMEDRTIEITQLNNRNNQLGGKKGNLKKGRKKRKEKNGDLETYRNITNIMAMSIS